MNVRLKKKFAWSTGMIYQGQFYINHYAADISMLTLSGDSVEQNIAYERIETWISDVLNGSVMIDSSDPLMETWQETGARLLALPTQPVDQIVGIMLYCKLNAITQDRLTITGVNLSSSLGDDMVYLHSYDESIGPFQEEGWWTDTRPSWSQEKRQNTGKVIRLDRLPEWNDYNLDWKESINAETDGVVFAKFSRDETK